MNPLKNFRSEAEFEQTALKQFYSSLETMWPHEKRVDRFGDLLEIFETYHHEMQWVPSVRPYLQYKFATELFTHNESQKKAVELWEKALKDQHCLEFLRARIIYSQANSHRSGQGHSKPRAFSYYKWVVGQSYAGTALKQQAKLDMANMLRIGHSELPRDRSKAKELYCELLKTLEANDPLLSEVYYGLATCYQDGLDGVAKDVVSALHYWILLFQAGYPKKLVERALRHKDACEVALKAEIEQLHSDKEVQQQALLDLERESRAMQSEKISLEKELENERQQNQEHKDQIGKDESEIKQLQVQVQTLTEQRDTVRRERTELNASLQAEQNENRHLKSALDTSQQMFDTSQKKLAIALEHIQKSRETAVDPTEHERIKKQLSDLQVANRQLKDKIADYERQFEKAQKDIRSIHDLQKSSINSLKAELIELKQMVTKLKEQAASDLLAIQKAADEEHEINVKELDLLKGYIVLLQNRQKEAEDDLTLL